MSRVGRRVRVTGRVQGVFFRAWTAEQAVSLRVTGWVRNCPDGSVEAHLAGEPKAIEQLTELLRRGPPAAHVASVEIDEVAPGDSARFEIRH